MAKPEWHYFYAHPGKNENIKIPSIVSKIAANLKGNIFVLFFFFFFVFFPLMTFPILAMNYFIQGQPLW